jgi:hypothetical protein
MMAVASFQEGEAESHPPPVLPNNAPPAPEGEVEPPTLPAIPNSAPPAPESATCLHLHEPKAVDALDGESDPDSMKWILDTGVSNHMFGSRAAFTNLDTSVTGSVRFGDGSIAHIKGTGTVLFHCRNDEHRALSNVYFLPRLTANIISVGQVDESGYQVLVEHGVMWVRDEDRCLRTKIPRSSG